MSRCLKNGSTIFLDSSRSNIDFRIENVRGVGGSCIAYEVSFYEDGCILHKGILKEFCPAYLGNLNRDNREIIVPEKYISQFQNGLSEFKETYCSINEYIASNASASNYHPVQLGLYKGNNTLYTLSSYDYGNSYDQIIDSSLYSLAKIMLAIAKGVQQYHNAGFLHLDIKPKNILILDDVIDIIKLFDFDSLTKIDDIKNGLVNGIPVPEDYYVPELNDLNLRNIGIQTDIFEIGAMFYLRLFRNAPQPENMGYDSEFEFDNAPLLNGITPKAVFEIEKFFRNTLQISKRRRYKTISQLISQLELIISLIDNKNPYLLNLPVWQPSKLCVERSDELRKIDFQLKKDGYVFIKGMGGLGKSEIAKMYVKEYSSQFHTVQFCKYVDSLKSLVASIPVSGINDEEYKSVDELAKVKNKILHQCDANTLIIVDNFNVTYDKYLREFLPSDNNGFKVVFTTRCIPVVDYYEDKVYELKPLSLECSKNLFYMHSEIERTLLADESIEELVNEFQFNTLLLVLVAKAVKRTKMNISEIIDKIRHQELDSVNVKVFYDYDYYAFDDIEVYNKINAHLNTVFNISKLTDNELEVLMDMTLISAYGIETEEFVSALNFNAEAFEIIDDLINQGWLEYRDKKIFMHSIISDIISEKGIEKSEYYYNLADHLEKICYVNEDFHISELQKALATAKQIERRYKTEDEISVAVINFLLSNIYMVLYRPKNAKECLDKARLIAEKEQDYENLPYMYNKCGDYESKFGTRSKAIDYYKRAIAVANETDGEFYDEISDAILRIAECYEENNEKDKALEQYKRLLSYRIKHNLNEYIDGIIKDIIALCDELDRQEDLLYYQNLLTNYETNSTEANDEILEKLSSDDYEQVQRDYEQFLSEIREQLGDESPYYKDIAKYRWVYFLINGDKEQAMHLIAENMFFIESTYGKDSMEMAEFLSFLSIQLVDNCEFDIALEAAERACEICRINHQEDSYAALRADLGRVVFYVVKGDSYSAYEIAKNLDFTKFSGSELLSDVIRSLGTVLVNLSMYEEAKDLADKTLNSKKIGRTEKIMATEIMIACYEQEGKIDKAQQYMADISAEIDSLSTLKFANDYLNIYKRMQARILFRKNEYRKAVESIDSIIELYSDKNTFDLYQCYLEKGVYLTYLKDYEEAEKCFDICEEITKLYNLSEKNKLLLYNNIAQIFYNKEDYRNAEKYYDKVFSIMPGIRNPQIYTEAVICQNYGWLKYNFNDSDKGEEYIKKAISYYKKKKLTDSVEYITAEYNLSLILAEQKRFLESLPLLLDTYDSIEKIQNKEYSVRIFVCTNILIGLLLSDEAEQAYDFANSEDRIIADLFGEESVERIEHLQEAAGAFKYCGYVESFEFLKKTRELIEKAKLKNSIWQARQDYYAGVTSFSLNNDTKTAQKHLKAAQVLLDNLSLQNTPLYSIVEKNL